MIDLRAEFRHFNRAYWNGRLPAVRVTYSQRMPQGAAEGTHPHGLVPCDLYCPAHCERSFIRIHRDIRHWDAFVLGSLLHGMVHLESLITPNRRRALALCAHGRIFHGRMKELAAAGAMQEFW